MGWGGVNSDPRRVHDGWDTPTRPSPHIVQHLRIWGRQGKPWGSKGRRGEARGGHVRQGEATGGQGRPGKARGSQGRQGKARGSQGRQKGGRGHPTASDDESASIWAWFALLGAGEGVGPPEASVGQGLGRGLVLEIRHTHAGSHPTKSNKSARNPSYARGFASNASIRKSIRSSRNAVLQHQGRTLAQSHAEAAQRPRRAERRPEITHQHCK